MNLNNFFVCLAIDILENGALSVRMNTSTVGDLVSHYVLDDGKLTVAHAGMKEWIQGRGSGAVREFALFGETTRETDEFGLPVRFNWAAEYRVVRWWSTGTHQCLKRSYSP